tara:strand:- start:513 stop:1442 length:930 start_codon:yes stop_codon:yes gene_type:complete
VGLDVKPTQLIWGCDSSRQFEKNWLRHLLPPLDCEISATPFENITSLPVNAGRVLVESGLLFLEKIIAEDRIYLLQKQRRQRLQLLADLGPFCLIHISDEEGLDGDLLYPMLPKGTCVWRNFPYPRFESHGLTIRSFPIGPRGEFLGPQPVVLSSSRRFPWTFMGTLWRSSQRLLSTSLFLRALPQGVYFGGKNFGQGVPLADYKNVLSDSVFALCPEGDRHFDTFRLFESLQMGCLPVVVEREGQARQVLGHDFPLPIFPDWPAALMFVRSNLPKPLVLDQMQDDVQSWWKRRKASLSALLHKDLLYS